MELIKTSIFWKMFSKYLLEGILIAIPLAALVQLTFVKPLTLGSGDVSAQTTDGYRWLPGDPIDGTTTTVPTTDPGYRWVPGERMDGYDVDGTSPSSPYPDTTGPVVTPPTVVEGTTYYVPGDDRGSYVIRTPAPTPYYSPHASPYYSQGGTIYVPGPDSGRSTVIKTPVPTSRTIYVEKPVTDRQVVIQREYYERTHPTQVVVRTPVPTPTTRTVYVDKHVPAPTTRTVYVDRPAPTVYIHPTPIPITVWPSQQVQNQTVNVAAPPVVTVPVTTTRVVAKTPVPVATYPVYPYTELPRTGPAAVLLLLGGTLPLALKMRKIALKREESFSANSLWQERELKK